jgi:hypothetical protein
VTTGQSLARIEPQRLVRSEKNESTRLDAMKEAFARAWAEDPDTLSVEERCLDDIENALQGEIKYHSGQRRRELWGAILKGHRARIQLADLIRLVLRGRGSIKAGQAADRVLHRLAAHRGLALIPIGSTHDRRHQAARRRAERRRQA